LRPQDELILDVFEAIRQRDWDRLPDLTHPDIEVVVHAGPEVELTINEHIWREVQVRGRNQLLEYLAAFFEALPSVSLAAVAETDADGCAWLQAQASGVDNEGAPFDARAVIELCERDGLVTSLRADVFEIVRGPDLLVQGGDPRRFFEPFLDETLVEPPQEGASAA
jgi:ketosteroid isomerase-like protein